MAASEIASHQDCLQAGAHLLLSEYEVCRVVCFSSIPAILFHSIQVLSLDIRAAHHRTKTHQPEHSQPLSSSPEEHMQNCPETPPAVSNSSSQPTCEHCQTAGSDTCPPPPSCSDCTRLQQSPASLLHTSCDVLHVGRSGSASNLRYTRDSPAGSVKADYNVILQGVQIWYSIDEGKQVIIKAADCLGLSEVLP